MKFAARQILWRAGINPYFSFANLVSKNSDTNKLKFVARQILWRAGVNPYYSFDNLVWAPNFHHSGNYAKQVDERLLEVAGQSKQKVAERLVKIGEAFIQGELGGPDESF